MGLVNSVYRAFLKDRNGLNKFLIAPCRVRYCFYNKKKTCVARGISV